MEEVCVDRWVSVTYGMRGWFAVLLGTFKDNKCTYTEPICSGIGSYKNSEDAKVEARDWAKAEELEYRD